MSHIRTRVAHPSNFAGKAPWKQETSYLDWSRTSLRQTNTYWSSIQITAIGDRSPFTPSRYRPVIESKDGPQTSEPRTNSDLEEPRLVTIFKIPGEAAVRTGTAATANRNSSSSSNTTQVTRSNIIWREGKLQSSPGSRKLQKCESSHDTREKPTF